MTKKHFVLFFSIGLILLAAVGTTVAFVSQRTASLNNSFTPASIDCQVNGNDDDTFDVTNISNVDVYVRAYVAVNWMDDSGNVSGIAPKEGTDFILTVNTADWYYDVSTGIYYHRQAIAPNRISADLITGIALNVTPPDGYSVSVEVVVEAIQAQGIKDGTTDTAFMDAWGISAISG